ncbi:MAG: Ig-like domain-containing protein, partial [Actinomycetota bacterium]
MTATRASSGVPWRRVLGLVAVVALGLGALVVAFRSDGLPAVDASSSQATRWFVHQPTNRVVLVDGFGGRALASLDAGEAGDELFTTEAQGQAFLLDDTLGDLRSIDTAELRLGSAQASAPLGNGTALARSTAAGLVVVNPFDGVAVLLPQGADAVPFEIDPVAINDAGAEQIVIATDGSVVQVVGDSLVRTTPQGAVGVPLGVSGSAVAVSAVGTEPLVLDRAAVAVRLGDGSWHALPTDAAGDELVLQQPGPRSTCGWVVADDDLWCVGSGGIERSVAVPGLGADGGDLLAIAGDSSALVRRGPNQVVHFDWRTEEVLDEQAISVAPDATLDVVATLDVIWVDDRGGDFVWSVHPWGIEEVRKNASDLLVIGEDGEIVEQGEGGTGVQAGSDDGIGQDDSFRDPDDNGVDDPPVAVDDQVTARSGTQVPVSVTANDFDPDGEAIAVASVGDAERGTVEVGTASTVVYTPEADFVGIDTFRYTIIDGDGTEASANVTVELLPTDANNQPPIGNADAAQTGPGVPVVVEVLLNDVDPERDALRIAQFSATPTLGEVTEVEGPTGLPALRYEPADGFEGRATFSYRPVDSFDAVGEPVDVVVEVARDGDENRPPIVRPDAARTRRSNPETIPVLVNDDDPDGDPLRLDVVRPLPDGLDVDVRNESLVVLARPGSGDVIPFQYVVDDGNGHIVRGSVLVVVIDEVEPNRPPVVSPDTATAVVGQTVLIDVTANDSDPDGDPLAVVGVSDAGGRGLTGVAGRSQVEFTAT